MNPYAPRKNKEKSPSPVQEETQGQSPLTICYITARKEPKLGWFLESLARQVVSKDEINVIIVDLHASARNCDELVGYGFNIHRVVPKPNVWCGEYRLTKTDWWAASAFRNTALCLCPTDWIAYVDDVSVLCSDWLLAAKEATTRKNTVTCGAYQKVKNLKVQKGEIQSFTEIDSGMDHRGASERRGVIPCRGNWLYGCSLVAPVSAILDVGGWPEFCDGASAEDTSLGMMLINIGVDLVYDPRLKTLESEEHHVYGMRREDKGKIGTKDSKSWAIVRKAEGTRYFDNYYEGGMRALRDHVLAGGSFPIPTEPTKDWYDGGLLCELE